MRTDHKPAKIVRQLLVDLGVGSDPDANLPWPIFAPDEPPKPDNLMSVKGTVGFDDGTDNTSGVLFEHLGLQLTVRAALGDDCWRKASAAADSIDRFPRYRSVTVDTSVYCVESLTRVGTVIDLGEEREEGRRSICTVNLLATIRQTV